MDNRQLELVNRLRERTLQGKVVWEPTLDEGTYQTALADYVVRIAQDPPEQARRCYYLRIYDHRAALIEEVALDPASVRYDEGSPEAEQHGAAVNAMRELHDLARRRALNVDQAYSKLLAALA